MICTTLFYKTHKDTGCQLKSCWHDRNSIELIRNSRCKTFPLNSVIPFATGSGKTFTYSLFIKAFHHALKQINSPTKILILVPTTVLDKQTEENIMEYMHHNAQICDLTKLSSTNKQDDGKGKAQIFIMTYAYAQQHIDTLTNEEFSLVIADEAHECLSSSRVKIFETLDCTKLLVTATPINQSREAQTKIKGSTGPLSSTYDAIGLLPHENPIQSYPIAKAIRDQMNSACSYQIVKTSVSVDLNLDALTMSFTDFEEALQKTNNRAYNNALVEYILTEKDKKTGYTLYDRDTMVFASSIAHIDTLTKLLNATVNAENDTNERYNYFKAHKEEIYKRNVRSHFNTAEEANQFLQDYPWVFADNIHSDFSKDVLAKKILRAKLGGTSKIISGKMFTAGVDLPHINCVVLTYPTFSETKMLKEIGRGLRLHAKKFSQIRLCDPKNPTICGLDEILISYDNLNNMRVCWLENHETLLTYSKPLTELRFNQNHLQALFALKISNNSEFIESIVSQFHCGLKVCSILQFIPNDLLNAIPSNFANHLEGGLYFQGIPPNYPIATILAPTFTTMSNSQNQYDVYTTQPHMIHNNAAGDELAQKISKEKIVKNKKPTDNDLAVSDDTVEKIRKAYIELQQHFTAKAGISINENNSSWPINSQSTKKSKLAEKPEKTEMERVKEIISRIDNLRTRIPDKLNAIPVMPACF